MNSIEAVPTLRIYPSYGDPPKCLASAVNELEYGYGREILEIFERSGFNVIKGGEFNCENPLELAISGEHISEVQGRYRDAARAGKIPMPRTYNPKEILELSDPVVAKLPWTERGEHKYLLRSPEQKVKFVSWALLGSSVARILDHGFIRISEKAFSYVEKGEFTEKEGQIDRWVFEEFVETPGPYYTSFRIVADSFGIIHYGQVLKSEQKKGKQFIPIPYDADLPDIEILELLFCKNSLFNLNVFDSLEHPASPFYIKPEQITSNVSTGGTEILLDEIPVSDKGCRELLDSLGINPNKPKIPSSLQEISSNIGRFSRRSYPYVGIDYLMRNNGEFVLLEVNNSPGLNPLGLKLPEDTDQRECEHEIIKRIISTTISKRHNIQSEPVREPSPVLR